MGCPTSLVTAVAAVFISPGALLTPAPKTTLFGRIPRACGVKIETGLSSEWRRTTEPKRAVVSAYAPTAQWRARPVRAASLGAAACLSDHQVYH